LATKLLDTNVCVSVIRGHPAAIERYIRELDDHTLRISVVTLFELLFGAYRSTRQSEELEKVGLFIEAGPPAVELTPEDAAKAAELRSDLARKGQLIGAYDLLIGGQGLARGWTVVTNDLREFSRIESLTIESW
jgi:tRNA(fMet)-specific endonuclease VapC